MEPEDETGDVARFFAHSSCRDLAAKVGPADAAVFEDAIETCTPFFDMESSDIAVPFMNAVADVCERHDANRFAAGPKTVEAVLDARRKWHAVHSWATSGACDEAWLRAVRWLVDGELSLETDSTNAMAFKSLGGLDDLVSMLQNVHRVQKAELQLACETVAVLARFHELEEILVEGGALDGVAVAAAYDLNNGPCEGPALLTAACWALRNLVFAPHADDAMVRDNVPEILLGAMERFRETEALQNHACTALCLMASETYNQRLVLTSQAKPRIAAAIRSALNNFPSSEGIQEFGNNVLALCKL